MSGHSKWATIKHQKGAKDKARGKLFAKLIRQVEVAAREGGGDIEANATLRTMYAKARAASVPIDTIAGMWVKPTVNTTYVVRQQLWCSGVKWDTVRVHMLSVGLAENALSGVNVFPNPSNGQISFSGLPAGEVFTLTFSDATGRIVYRNQITDVSKIETELPEGFYLVMVNSETARMTRRIAIVR